MSRALDAETLRAVAEAFEADMSEHDYCCGSEKCVRLILKGLGAPITSCECGARPVAGLEFCEYCDPNRVRRPPIVNAGQKFAEAWAEMAAKMKEPYNSAFLYEHLWK